MKKKLQIATIKANNVTFQGCELYWIFSRNHLEFLFRELEIFSSPSLVATAKYQEVMLPVINLEKYYGLAQKVQNGAPKYLVVRSVTEQNELVKLIIQTPQAVKIQALETGFIALQSPPALPKNNNDVLGIYSLATDKIGIVPDFIAMSRSIQLRGN
jgi:hypothetical protein